MSGRLQDKVALVTGIGTQGEGVGNGQAIGLVFAREGARIFGCDINASAAQVSAENIRAEGAEIAVSTTDVTNSQQVEALIAQCRETYGRIDILINNVGYSASGGPVEMPEGIWDEQLNVNLKSVFLTCKHVLPVMQKQGYGAIVNISSVAGLRHLGRDNVGYMTAKAALLKFSEFVAVKYAAENIRCNTVVPGLIETPLAARIARIYGYGEGDDGVKKFFAARRKTVPMKRMGDPWDVAHAALYFASDEAKYTTGAQLVVDGGLTLKSTDYPEESQP